MGNSMNSSSESLSLPEANGWRGPARKHTETFQEVEFPETLSIDQLLALDASPVNPIPAYPAGAASTQQVPADVLRDFEEVLRGVRTQLNAVTEGEMDKITAAAMSKAQDKAPEAGGGGQSATPQIGRASLATNPASKASGKGQARGGHLVLAKGTWDFVRQSLRLSRRPAAEPETANAATAAEASQAPAAVKEPEPPSPIVLEPQVYQGKVRLSVRSPSSAAYVMQFVRQVSAMPELRLLRLAATRKEGLEMLVGLREPLPLEERLSQMPRVAAAKSIPGHDAASQEPLIEVSLAEA